MSASWSEIFPDVDGPPVRGEPGDFRRARQAFDSMGNDAQSALDQFHRITSQGGASELQGQAATAFERFVREVADSLADLPRVSHEAVDVFQHHADELEDLRREVDSALARAETKWNDRRDVRNRLDDANDRASRIQSQIDSLPPSGTDPTADSQRGDLDSSHSSAASDVSSLSGRLDDIDDALRGIRREWTELHEREAQLRRHTRDSLDGIDLGDLEDPGRFGSFIEGAFEFVMNVTMIDEIADLVAAALDGDWAAVLWKLREVLDVVLLVIAVVASFTPLGPLVLAIAFGLALAKLAIDVALYATKWPNPATGEVISATDLVMDAVAVGISGWGLRTVLTKGIQPTLLETGRDMLRLRGANIAQRSQILRRQGMTPIHAITSGRGWNLSRIEQVKGVPKFVAGTGGKIYGAEGNARKAPNVLTAPFGDRLSTNVFDSIARGHSAPQGLPERITVHLLPNTQRTTTCRAA